MQPALKLALNVSKIILQKLFLIYTGLFQRAIIQSGGALIYSARGSRNGRQLAKALGKEDASEKEILEILEKLPLKKLLEVQDSFYDVSSS